MVSGSWPSSLMVGCRRGESRGGIVVIYSSDGTSEPLAFDSATGAESRSSGNCACAHPGRGAERDEPPAHTERIPDGLACAEVM